MKLNFKRATDELLSCISHEELAAALDKSVPSVRQARLDKTAKAFRSAPQGWERAVIRLASQRASRLSRLVAALERQEQSSNER